VKPFPPENIYGHFARVSWMLDHITTEDRIVEIGCGTGYRVTLPLARWGYQVVGIDRSRASIAYGRELMARAGLPPDTVRQGDLDVIPFRPTVVILSEVLEHVPDAELPGLLRAVWETLCPGGLLLATTPNGYGYFELESFVYFKLGLGRILSATRFTRAWPLAKTLLFSGQTRNRTASTLDSAPHVQRFTFKGFQRLLESNGFHVEQAEGSVLACGPLCDLLFTGSLSLQELNRRVGRRLPRIASGFYAAARKVDIGGTL
jgi:SAM-dependent methyltransferase